MKNLRTIDLNLLTVFEALFIERNLTRAAARVGLSQPAMSNALARLRATLEDDLFVRTGRTMQPTTRARQFATPIQEALDLIRSGLNTEEEFDPETGRAFTVAGLEHLDLIFMPALVRRMQPYLGRIHLRCRYGSGQMAVEKLTTGEVDLMLDFKPPENPEIMCQEIAQDQLVVVMRKDHPLADEPMTPETYSKLEHVAPEEVVRRFFLDRELRSKGIDRQISVTTNNVFSMPIIAANTDMTCTVSELISGVFQKAFQFKVYPAPLDDPSFKIFMAWHNSRTHDADHRWLREHMEAVGAEVMAAKINSTNSDA